jgi:mannose-1-phosphate guanylyltransferase
MKRTAVILAGGAGTRLWPLSSDDEPKQFLKLFDGQSLLQKTWLRLSKFIDADSIYISTNHRYRDRCIEQLPSLPPANVITEPARRNTAPAIALCTWTIEARHGENVTGFFPSDAYIGDEAEFLRVIETAYAFAERSDYLVTIGLAATEPNTGYGYLELGEELAPGVIRLSSFKEKPDRTTAESFLAAGNYAWNGGMFVWRSGAFRAAVSSITPALLDVTLETYEQAPATSIDFGLMEKATLVATVRGDFGWSDVGSWAAIAHHVDGRKEGVFTEQAQNVFVHTTDARKVAVIGLSNIAVIDSPEGLLVLNLDDAELLSRVAKRITESS